jgi:hypothetical protein
MSSYFFGTSGFILFPGIYDHLKLDWDDQFVQNSRIKNHVY